MMLCALKLKVSVIFEFANGILKKDPTLSITKLSERANVSHGYASQVHAHVLSEHHHNPFPCG